MKPWQWDVALFVLASPILAVRACVRFVRYLKFLRRTVEPTIPFRTCGGTIHLLGMWRCTCGFTAEGHLLRNCPVCGSFPAMVRCYGCGATESIRR